MISKPLRGWRRVAMAMWPAPHDPQIYGQLDIEAGPLLSFIETARKAGHHVTVTHLVARALATALKAVPELNVRIVGSRSIQRPRIEIFFITAVYGERDDLSGVKVDVTGCDVFEVGTALERGAGRLRGGDDRAFARSKRLMDSLPPTLLRAALHATALVTERMQWNIPRLALSSSPFGSAMISSVGSLGLSQGFAPLSWMYDVPVLLLVGEIAERAVVVEGKVVARPVLPLSATIDHRYIDGVHLSRAMRALRGYLQSPADYEPTLLPVADQGARV